MKGSATSRERRQAAVTARAILEILVAHGTHSSIGSPFADSASAVARALGHTEEVNRAHYTTPEAAAASTQRRLR